MTSRAGIPREHRTPAVDRLLDKCTNVDGCWIFQGARNPLGYGMISDEDGKTQKSHRVAYQFFVGDIPAGLVLDHLCRNPSCCNPWHVEPVTQGVNVRRGRSLGRRKVACIRGHRFDKENTAIGTGGKRVCRTCARDYMREYYQARRVAS